MSNTKHTPGPLTYNQKPVAHRYNIEDVGGLIIASAYKEEDSARIVACVNALEGIEDPAKQIPEMIDVLKQFWNASESGDLDRHDWNALEQVLLGLRVLK